MTRKSDLNRLYNSRVIHAERVRRPLGNLPVAIGPLSHSGVRVTLDNGKKYLIHKGPGFGRTSQTVVVDANHMSDRWKASGRAKSFPHDMTRKSDLNRLYNARVIHAERVRRPLGNLPVAIGPLSHSGVRVTLDNGKKYLIHKGPGFGRTSQTVVVDANHMSNRWKASIPNNTQYTIHIQVLRSGEEVLARWTDCRYYPAKVESVSKEGTYTVQFYDGVIRCVKRMHIKSMPEDAKGQDWIALVKAATAAAKNKGACKPRTSANSNKDKEERRAGRASPGKEGESSSLEEMQDAQEAVEEPGPTEKLDKTDASIEAEQPEPVKGKRKKSNQGSSFQAKRARLNKITASTEDQEKTDTEAASSSPPIQKHVLPSATPPAPVKSRNRRLKHDSGEPTGSHTQSKSSCTVSQAEESSPAAESVSAPTPTPAPTPSTADTPQTGLLVSKVAYEDEHENKEKKSEVPQISEKEPSASTEDQERTDTEATSSPPIQKHVLPSATPPAPVKSRNRRLKHDSGEPTGSHTQSKSSCTVSQAEESSPAAESVSAPTPTPAPTPSTADTPQTALPLPTPASPPRPSEQSQRRRRSQRLATFIPDPFCEPLHSLPSATDGKRLAQKPESQQDLPVPEVLDTRSVPPEEPELPLDLSKSATVAATPPPPAPPVPPPQPPETDKEESPPLKTPADVKTASPTTAAVLKGVPKPLKPNKHAREPIINTKKPEDPSSPKEALIDLDHNKLKCKIPGCSKAFRKAKLLDYHLKYYHSMDKERESETVSPERAVRTRAASASVPESTAPESHDAKRRRTVSTSASLSSHVHVLQLESPLSTGLKPSKCSKKKRSSASVSSDGTDAQFPVPPCEKGFESLHEKILKRVIEKDKHAEPDYSDFEDISLAFLERCTSPVTRSSGNSLAQRNTSSSKHASFQYPRAILSVDLTGENLSDIDFLEDSSTESLLLSGDEYNQDFDSFNLEDSQDEDDAANEIVRCICEMDEENGFMIQCEECMCWQHSVCMGLLEDSIPEQYICYVCRDPPGQRWSAKYQHDKDWLYKGHMYGLSFLSENYSHQNAKNIVSTHQLLADVYSVKKALRGLQLKMDILQNKHNPNLHLWARSWVNPDEEQPMGGFPACIHHQERIADCINHNSNQKAEDTYITNEHSYQKPSGFGLEHNTAADFMSSDGEDAVRLDEEPEAMSEVGTNSVPKEQQVNLLTHIDGVQNQVAGRMDLIEKELDGSSFCQLHRQQVLLRGDVTYIPQCSNSGDYETGQCDTVLKQCWCVDAEGMEIYGTRQNGKLDRCPGSCEVRERRLLHGVGEKSPPQCSAEGEFLPVQCKFINTTDMMVFDLLHTFNRFPGIFQTFSGFRKMFPEVSGYCFCTDSRGRELAGTGLELLLNEVYDTAFSEFNPGHSFTQSNMYRILQRRFLGVQLAMSGQFRCPTGCETERSMAVQTGSVFVPSCGENGNYKPMQCQDGGQCWCVDSSGKEIFGSRQQGGIPVCGNSDKDCPSERRQALSRLFYGPAGFFSQHDIFSTPEAGDENLVKTLSPCSADLKELFVKSGLLLSLPEFSKSNVEVMLGEVIRGMFPSKEMALKALRLTTTPKRLQENLFGGKFLKNVGQFNFTGAVGPRGTFSFKQIFQQVGLTEKTNGEDFVLLAKLFSSEDDSLLIKQEILNLDQKIRDGFGRDVNLKENQNLVKLVGSVLENEQFFTTVRDIISFFRTEETEDLGSLFQAVFQSAKAGVCDGDSSGTFVPQCSTNGEFEEVQCLGSECWCVDPQGKEIPGSRVPGKRPRCPSKCEKERETAKLMKASQAAGSEVFIPWCETDGSFKSIQCSGKSCFCMLGTGIEGTRTTLGEPLQCPTACQLTAAQQFLSTVQSLLSESSPVSHLSDVYIPQCNLDGSWREVQCDGPPEQVFQFYHEWVNQNNAGQELPAMDIIDKIRGYQKLPETLTSFKAFVKELYNAGHQKVFPVFSRYETFGDVPLEVLAGDDSSVSGSTVLFNPLAFWRLLVGNSTFYPGQLSDFSVALGHFQLRQCWCVDGNGQMMAGTKALVNEVPKSLHFYWQTHSASAFRQGDGFLLGFRPYTPQCNGLGHWEPTQCSESTGGTTCRRARSKALLSDWRQAGSEPSATDTNLLNPSCQEVWDSHMFVIENGVFSVLQRGEGGHAWCVNPSTGKTLQPADQSMDGSSQCPQCPLPFSEPLVYNGIVLCKDVISNGQRKQQCQLSCRQGYHSTLPGDSFLCDVASGTWVSAAPHPHACQSKYPWFQSSLPVHCSEIL
ncbi:UNVERIFIED_CONTAM: hypothetical protein FKN15_037207 [Acipenser sinensis]